MAHFAEIDENNKVIRVLVVDNSQENRGQEFLAVDCGLGGTWIQTSYNNNFRGKFATVGDVYNSSLDKFESAKPFQSWIKNSSGDWEAPIPAPNDGGNYIWSEEDQNWITRS
jgi:hypothetical protein